ncbi:penicillin-binding protein activator LpoB [Roseimaritima ulvae]|uniref:Penicillin-binding protein activator LpoB n=1 Tax=Roseimaritima ulvae TaxID=980254 RepID=A0A5B9R5A2_9BACT|nr:penicillin-binding protein activator LpoB [Roseimaritima ulvae]QEG41671.1 hypothetical protein UC8_36970 [Roseimaritima ulvae]
MRRRDFLKLHVAWAPLAALGISAGCAGRRYAHILKPGDTDLVGSHQAGSAVWNPLVDEAVAKLLSRCPTVQPAAYQAAPGQLPPPQPNGPATVCFIGIENKGIEELVDFKDQLYERIDSQINGNAGFRSISRRMVDAALLETRLRPDSLFVPHNRDVFAAALGRQGAPVDHLLYARITSGTTERNESTQRDYLLTLEMVDLHSGEYIKESATISKGYHKSRAGKIWNYGLFNQADG